MPTPPRKKTLDRVLSQAGIGSRKEARQWIGAGRVAVDGKKIQTPDAWVDAEHQRVTLDGKPLRAARKIYLLLYKPKGYVTTYKDPDGRPTVYDLLQDVPEKVFSAGRLDLDSSGLLIFTNDGEFADHITSPESHVPKTYLVKSSLLLTDDQLDQLRQGVALTDGPTRPAQVARIRDSGRYTFFEITITEGRNRHDSDRGLTNWKGPRSERPGSSRINVNTIYFGARRPGSASSTCGISRSLPRA